VSDPGSEPARSSEPGSEPATAGEPHRPWWESTVVYQIYPRSFCDTTGNGVGDLEGIRRHLDHLSWLGVDAVWLSPFYPSPMADFGYDVADYCDVDPLFGTLDDFDQLTADAHRRGIRVLVDWVPNHTSDQHPWFVAARSAREDPKRDWYWWRDGRPDITGGSGLPGSVGRLPNNWRASFPGVGRTEFPPAWTWDPATAQWYLHFFLAEQPDLNWANAEVRAAMTDVLRFWLARGVDGFRIDVVHGIGKDPDLPDLPADLAPLPASALNDQPATHPILADLRTLLDSWADPPRMMVGEVFLLDPRQVPPYYGTPERPELHLAFNFKPLFTPWDAAAWRRRIDEVEDLFTPVGAWPTWVLSNHDRPRHRTRFGSEGRARAAAVLLLTLRGTPFLYAGEELGLEDAAVPPDRRVDPGGRDGSRAPLPWDDTPAHGWAGGPDPWLPWPPEAAAGRTVAAQLEDQTSMLHLYRRLLAARRASPALRAGGFSWIESPAGVLAYRRRLDQPEPSPTDERVIAVNFTDAATGVELPAGEWELDVATGPDGGGPDGGGPDGGGPDGGGPDGGQHRWRGWYPLEADAAAVLRPVRADTATSVGRSGHR
jgi:alpha-glucosidase